MTTSDDTFNPFVLPATLDAEQLVEAFDNQDPVFGDLFASADRVVLGAMVAYASLAMREVAVRDGVPLPDVRHRLRAQVADSVAFVAAAQEKEV